MEFGLVIGCIQYLQNVTTSKDYTLTVLHTLQITVTTHSLTHSLMELSPS
jgi:hypothetical protein